MDLGGEVLVSELRSTVVDDDIAIGSAADRCLLSGEKQTSHFKGVRTVFDPNVWSGRALQEVSSTWQMRSCINVSGLWLVSLSQTYWLAVDRESGDADL
jgi:hypothetical protein